MAGFKQGALQLRKIDSSVASDPSFVKILVDTTYNLYMVDEFGIYHSVAGYNIISSGSDISVVTSGGTKILSLNPTGVTSGTYGTSTAVPQIIVDDNGRILSAYNIPISASGLGTVTYVGLNSNTLSITNSAVTTSGTISVNLSSVGTSGIYSKVVTDSYGRVISGSNITSADFPTLSYLPLSGGTLTGTLKGPTISASTLAGDIIYGNLIGIASQATSAYKTDQLKTGRDFSISGDTYSNIQNFDGTSNIVLNTTLSNVGTSGIYTKIVTDSKGRVISGSNITSADFPQLAYLPLSGGTLTGLLNGTNISANNISGNFYGNLTGIADKATSAFQSDKLKTARTFSLSGDVYSNVPTFDGSGNIVFNTNLSAINTAGTYTKVTTDNQGRVLNGSNITSADIPSLNYLPLSGGTLTGLLNGTNISANNISGSFVGNLTGIASQATSAFQTDKLKTARAISITGDISAVSASFDGTGNISFSTVLSSTGITSGNYGSVNQIPRFLVDNKGRLISATNISISVGTVSSVGISSTTLSVSNSPVTSSGVISVNLSSAGTSGTYTKVSTDSYGRVISGSNITSSDIPNLNYLPLSGGTLTGNLTTTINPNLVLFSNATKVMTGSSAFTWDGNTLGVGLDNTISSPKFSIQNNTTVSGGPEINLIGAAGGASDTNATKINFDGGSGAHRFINTTRPLFKFQRNDGSNWNTIFENASTASSDVGLKFYGAISVSSTFTLNTSANGILKATNGVVNTATSSDFPQLSYLPLSGGTLTGNLTTTINPNLVLFSNATKVMTGSSAFTWDGNTLGLGTNVAVNNPTITLRQNPGGEGGAEITIGAAGGAGGEEAASAKLYMVNNRFRSATNSSFMFQKYITSTSAWTNVWGTSGSGAASFGTQFYGTVSVSSTFTLNQSYNGMLKATNGDVSVATSSDFPQLAYLPLSGGTLTGLLNGTNISANNISGSFVGNLTGIASQATSAFQSDKLKTARAISITGDVSATSASFDGSSNISFSTILSSVGTSGIYTKVSTDSKGRVISGTNLTSADIPSLNYLPLSGGTVTGNLNGTNISANNISGVTLNIGNISNTEFSYLDGTSANIQNQFNNISANFAQSSSLSSYQLLSQKNTSLGYAGLDTNSKIYSSALPDAILGQLHYLGIWNATTNTPTIVSANLVSGAFYVVSVSGTTIPVTLNPNTSASLWPSGAIEWKVGDWIVSDGTYWDKIDNTDSISSWNGRLGAILPISGDYTAAQITNTPAGNITSINVQNAINELDSEKAQNTIVISAGIGLTGGGDLTTNRTLSLATTGTSGIYTKISTDAYGRVISGTTLTTSDIPVLTASYLPLSGGTLTGNLTTTINPNLVYFSNASKVMTGSSAFTWDGNTLGVGLDNTISSPKFSIQNDTGSAGGPEINLIGQAGSASDINSSKISFGSGSGANRLINTTQPLFKFQRNDGANWNTIFENATSVVSDLGLKFYGSISTSSYILGASLNVDKTSGTSRDLYFNTNGVIRWIFRANATAETGSNAGTDFEIQARSDLGAVIDTPISITRVSGGNISFIRPLISTQKITSNGLNNSSFAGVASVLVSDTSKNIVESSVTTTTLGYLDVTSSIQTQLNSKANSSTLSNYLPLSGGTLTGNLTTTINPNLVLFSNATKVMTGSSAFTWDGTTLGLGTNISVNNPKIVLRQNPGNDGGAEITLGAAGGTSGEEIASSKLYMSNYRFRSTTGSKFSFQKYNSSTSAYDSIFENADATGTLTQFYGPVTVSSTFTLNTSANGILKATNGVVNTATSADFPQLAYLPLSGGTLTGNLNGTNISANNVSAINFTDTNFSNNKILYSSANIISESTTSTSSLAFINNVSADIQNQINSKADFSLFGILTEPTGFLTRTNSYLSFNNGTRTFTISALSASFDVYYRGNKFTKTTESIQISTTSGSHFIYYTSAGTLTESTVAWDIPTTIQIAIVYWTGTSALILSEERHGLVMDCATHQYLHTTFGTRYASGFISTYTLSNDSSANFGLSDGRIEDEDIVIDISQGTSGGYFTQQINYPGYFPVYYRQGTDGIGTWRKDSATTFPYKNSAPNTRANYNELVGGIWKQTTPGNNSYIAYYIYATSNFAEPIISVQGQRSDSSLVNAQNNNIPTTSLFPDFPIVEAKLLYRIIINVSTANNGNTYLAKISDVTDYRAQLISNGAITGGTGTVTSVSLSTPSIFSVSGSPIINAGTLSFDFNNQLSGTFLAGPISGTSAYPTFRNITSSDIPLLSNLYLPLSGGTLTGLLNGTNISANNISGAFVGNLTGIASQATSAFQSDKLKTSRAISIIGDVSAISASFDGTGNISFSTILSSVGTSGIYTKISTDSKGRVISGTNLTSADIPNLNYLPLSGGTLTGNLTTTINPNLVYFSNATKVMTGSSALTWDGTTLGLGTNVSVNNPTINLRQNPGNDGGAEITLGAAGGTSGEEIASSKLYMSNYRFRSTTGSKFSFQKYNGSTSAYDSIFENADATGTLTKFYGPVTVSSTFTLNTSANGILKATNGVVNTYTLTSGDIPTLNYLPLSGGTLSGLLNGTNISANNISGAFAGNLTGIASQSTSAFQSDKLKTARAISIIGDVSAISASFDGTGNISFSTILSSVGTSGIYTKISTDSKGRVISGTILTSADIPVLSNLYLPLSGGTVTGNLNVSGNFQAKNRFYSDGYNTFVGLSAGNSFSIFNSTNALFGSLAGFNLNGGGANTLIGGNVAYSLISGNDNAVVGAGAYYFGQGSHNAILGTNGAQTLIGGNNNTFLGCGVGSYITSANNLLIIDAYGDSAGRSNSAAELNNSLIVGQAAATTNLQTINLNANTTIPQNLNVSGTFKLNTLNGILKATSGTVSTATSSDFPQLAYLPLSGGSLTGLLNGTNISANNISGAFVGNLTGIASQSTSAFQSDKLKTARDISIVGDVSAISASFDGSSNISFSTILSSVGTSGIYTKVSTDAKGRVISGSNITSSDIPVLSNLYLPLSGGTLTGNLTTTINPNLVLFSNATKVMTGSSAFTWDGTTLGLGTNVSVINPTINLRQNPGSAGGPEINLIGQAGSASDINSSKISFGSGSGANRLINTTQPLFKFQRNDGSNWNTIFENATSVVSDLGLKFYGSISTSSYILGASLNVDKASSTSRDLYFNSNGVIRWIFRANSTTETGSNAGTDFEIQARSDLGAIIDTPISITRVSGGNISFIRPLISTQKITANGLNNSSFSGVASILVSDTSKNIVESSVTTTTLGYLDATSSIQTQLNSKANSSTLSNYLPLSGGTLTGNLTTTINPNLVYFSNATKVMTGSSALTWDGTTLGLGTNVSVNNPTINLRQNPGAEGGAEITMGAAGGSGGQDLASAKITMVNNRFRSATNSSFMFQKYISSTSAWTNVWGTSGSGATSFGTQFYGTVSVSSTFTLNQSYNGMLKVTNGDVSVATSADFTPYLSNAYLPLSGGTMRGSIFVNSYSGGGNPAIITNTGVGNLYTLGLDYYTTSDIQTGSLRFSSAAYIGAVGSTVQGDIFSSNGSSNSLYIKGYGSEDFSGLFFGHLANKMYIGASRVDGYNILYLGSGNVIKVSASGFYATNSHILFGDSPFVDDYYFNNYNYTLMRGTTEFLNNVKFQSNKVQFNTSAEFNDIADFNGDSTFYANTIFNGYSTFNTSAKFFDDVEFDSTAYFNHTTKLSNIQSLTICQLSAISVTADNLSLCAIPNGYNYYTLFPSGGSNYRNYRLPTPTSPKTICLFCGAYGASNGPFVHKPTSGLLYNSSGDSTDYFMARGVIFLAFDGVDWWVSSSL